MKYQPKSDYVSNDKVMTPRPLARAIVEHFSPQGAVLEPCCGDGSFVEAVKNKFDRNHCGWMRETLHTCEIDAGRDFFDWNDPVDWIITNPPWSQIRQFLLHGMQVSSNIVFLMTVNHAWTKARLRDVRDLGFGIREIAICDTPKEFPASGFQLGAVHYQHGWAGDIKFSEIKYDKS